MLPAMSKTVLVSGCSTGFGFRAARALAIRGHEVFAGLPEPAGRHEQRAEELREAGAIPFALDVAQDASVISGVEGVLAQSDGRLEVVVSGAAYSVMGPLEACRPEQLLSMLNTNVVGALRLFRAVLPTMRAAGGGRVVQLTSGLGRAAIPFMGVYSASAWAQECFAETLHYEARAFGIEVVVLEPSFYRDQGLPRKPVGDEDRIAAYQAQLVALAERMQDDGPDEAGDAEEVADAVVFAVEAQQVPLRTAIGAAARELLELRARLTAAEYEREILDRAGLA